MKPDTYFASLHYNQQPVYADKAGTTAAYLRCHIFRKKGRSRNPGFEIIVGLAEASEGQVTLEEAIQYFLVDPVLRLAAQKQRAALSIGKVEQGGDESLCAGNRLGL